MPDLDGALRELSGLASRPPLEVPDLERVRTAVRGKRRRRAAGGGAVALLVLCVVVIGWALPRRDPTVDVIDEPATTTSTTEWQIPPGIVIEPSTGLDDGDIVWVTGSFSPSSIQGVGLCAEEGRDEADRVAWCDLNAASRQLSMDGVLTVAVSRRIVTPHGVFDCAERPGRCLLGVRDNQGVDRSAPISFRDDLGPLSTPTFSVDRATVAEGDSVTVTVANLQSVRPAREAATSVTVAQCAGSPGERWEVSATWAVCDGATSGASGAIGGDGIARVVVAPRSSILTTTGWRPCVPCVLVVSVSGWADAVVIEVVPAETPARPTVRIVPEGPYEPGQRVRLEGAGFRPMSTPIVGWCAFRTDQPETEIQGDSRYGYTACAYPSEAFGVVVDAGGRFVVDDYPLPEGGVQGDSCVDPTFHCGLAWHPDEGLPPAFVTLFELAP